MTPPDVMRRVIAALDDAGIPYLVVGSFASTNYGPPRGTNDVDILIDPTSESLDRFVNAFDDDLYVSPSAQEALERRDMFNVIDASSGWKVDLIVRKEDPFSQAQIEHRVRTNLADLEFWVASAEDTVLAKLQWAAMGGSGRQIEDASGVLELKRDTIDNEYLDRWAAELGVTELLERARQES